MTVTGTTPAYLRSHFHPSISVKNPRRHRRQTHRLRSERRVRARRFPRRSIKPVRRAIHRMTTNLPRRNPSITTSPSARKNELLFLFFFPRAFSFAAFLRWKTRHTRRCTTFSPNRRTAFRSLDFHRTSPLFSTALAMRIS